MTQEDIKGIWEYIPEKDHFIWKIGSKIRKKGSIVSSNTGRVVIHSKEYRYERLKNLYLYNEPYYISSIPKDTLSISDLKKVLSYDYETGIFKWLETRGPNSLKGSQAGSLENTGYISIRIGRKSYLAHRLAWFYCFEEWPIDMIDHIDRNKTNNSLDNLREATCMQNSRNRGLNKNNTSGYVGVHISKGKWAAEIIINGIKHRLGKYDNKEEASLAYKTFEKEHGHAGFTIG